MVLDDVIPEMGRIPLDHAKVVDVAAKVVIFTTRRGAGVRPRCKPKAAEG